MRSLALLSVLALAGCAAAPASGPAMGGATMGTIDRGGGSAVTVRTEVTPVNNTVPFPMDRVWPALIATYTKLGIPMPAPDAAGHTLASPDFRPRGRIGGKAASQFINCGMNGMGAQLADLYSLRINMQTQLTPTADGTRITTTIDTWARNSGGVSADAIHCSSNGEFERMIANTVLTSIQ